VPDERIVHVPYAKFSVGAGGGRDAGGSGSTTTAAAGNEAAAADTISGNSLLEGVAAALDAHLDGDGSSSDILIPFVWPKVVAHRQRRRPRNSNNNNGGSRQSSLSSSSSPLPPLVLYGISGSGKTRCLFELVKSKRPASVYIINPKGLPEGAVRRTHLADVLGQCGRGDIIVWDNFPDGLEKMSAENARLALRMLAASYSSSSSSTAYVSLNPEYIEKNGVESLHGLGLDVVHLAYSQQDVKRLLSLCGKRFLARRYFAAIRPELAAIAAALWQAEPTPAAVLDYMQELGRPSDRQDDGSDGGGGSGGGGQAALAAAKKFVRRSAHFEQQFGILKSARRRRADVHFLYTLEMCHELGLGRKVEQVVGLQERIFSTRPADDDSGSGGGRLLERLQLWLYVAAVGTSGSGGSDQRKAAVAAGQVSIHDTARRAVAAERERDRSAVSSIMEFLAANYAEVVPAGDQSAYLFGSFVGKNCRLARARDIAALLPPEKKQGGRGGEGAAAGRNNDDNYDDVRRRRFYQIGLGHGIGRMLGSNGSGGGSGTGLGKGLLGKVLAAAATNSQFGRNLGEGIGWEIVGVPPALYARVFSFAGRNLVFSRGLGIGIGMSIPRLPSHIKKDIFMQAERNVQFADGLGIGAGTIIEFMPAEEHVWLFRTAESNSEFARGLGTGLAHSFVSLPERIQLYALSLAAQNPQFARGLGMGFGDAYAYLPEGLQKEAVSMAGRNPEFAAGLGTGMGYSFSYLTGKLQELILQLAQRNPQFAYGAGVGIGFTYYYLKPQVQDAMMTDRAQSNHMFAVGMGDGFGLSFALLPKQWQSGVLAAVERNTSIALGFGMGIGYAYHYLGREMQRRMWALSGRSSQFAEGMGYSLGRVFNLHADERLKRSVITAAALPPSSIQQRKKVTRNADSLSFGIGHGLGFSYLYLPQEAKEELFKTAGKNERFAAGLGWGLGTMFGYFTDSQQEQVLEECRRVAVGGAEEEGSGGRGGDTLGGWVKRGMVEVWQYLDEGDREYAQRFGALAPIGSKSSSSSGSDDNEGIAMNRGRKKQRGKGDNKSSIYS
jgi:hypothetical protein